LKMFTSGFREQSASEVNLPDIDQERLRAVLDWMYGRQAVVDVSSPAMAIGLLEVAEMWQIVELCEQLSVCDACSLEDATVLQIWEAAQRMSLSKLEARCRSYVMCSLATFLELAGEPGTLPPLWRRLGVQQVQVLLDNDDLPVFNEEQVVEFALAYIQDHRPTLTTAQMESILLAVRWRLVPGPVIAERGMCPTCTTWRTTDISPRLLGALADGMRFQLLGGKAWTTLEATSSNRLRKYHRIPVGSYAGLAPGMTVRVISDADELKHLCKRCAPGARMKVEWVADMKSLAGATCRVLELRDEICGAQLEDPYEKVIRYLPFDALLLA